MRTPVVLVAGQGAGTDVADVLIRTPGTAVVGYAAEGHVVIRRVSGMRDTKLVITQWPLEITNCCVTCTIRNDLLILLRQLHRRSDVHRIVVHLMEWLDPEAICTAINDTPVQLGPGYIDGPAGRDGHIPTGRDPQINRLAVGNQPARLAAGQVKIDLVEIIRHKRYFFL